MRVAEFATATHAGRVRRKNEDAYYAEPPLFAVADGMGGALAGELASRISVQTLAELVQEGSDEERLAETIRLANRRVAERATSDPRASGMGSTVTAALVGRGVVTFAHVGDSRAYLWRGGVLTRLSDDHSLVAEWVRAGALAPEDAAQHPQRSVITRALGADWQIDIDVWTTPARTGRRDPALHGRPQRVRRRRGRRAHARGARDAGRRGARARRRGQRRGRRGQHHRRGDPARGRGGGARRRRGDRRGGRAPDRHARGGHPRADQPRGCRRAGAGGGARTGCRAGARRDGRGARGAAARGRAGAGRSARRAPRAGAAARARRDA